MLSKMLQPSQLTLGYFFMKKFVLIALIMLIVNSISSCNYKNPADETNRKMDEIVEKHRKENEEILKNLEIAFSGGGQPGLITVTGVVVSVDSSLNSRISTSALAGVGKDGKIAVVADQNKPVYKNEVSSERSIDFSSDKTIVSFGCDEKLIADYAKNNDLEVKKILPTTDTEVVIISANTLYLCKDLAELPLQPNKIISSDHLMLEGVDYTLVGNIGSLNFTTNRLTLLGENKITTRGRATSMIVLSASAINLRVFEEFTPQDDGKLLLTSIGSDYAPEENKNNK